MRLISCFIEGFGKYQNRQFDFEQGLTSFCLDNGEGKTTLAAFLRAMLYGMDTDRGTSFGERSAYCPFQGGNYGGWLKLEWQGKEYKIVRSFDKKSAAKDTLSVFDGKEQPCDSLGEKVGERLFGLSREAFDRTSYITWKQIDIGLGDGIGERLGGAVSGASPVTLKKALEAIESKGKEYHSDRRSGGFYTGYIPDLEKKSLLIETKISEAERAEKELSEKQVVFASLWEENRAMAAKIDEMQGAGMRRSQWEHYQSLLKDAENYALQERELLEKYPQGFPTEEELSFVGVKQQNARFTRMRLEERAFPKQWELDEAEAQFSSGVPSNDTLAQKESLINEYLRLKLTKESAAPAPIPAPTIGKKMRTVIALGLISILLIIAGLAVLAVSPIATAICAAAGGVGIVVSGVLYAKNKKTADGTPVAAPMPDTSMIDEAGLNLSEFFRQYGIYTTDFSAAMTQLKKEIASLSALRAEKAAYEAETAAMQESERAEGAAVQAMLVRYALSESGWSNAAADLRAYTEAARLAKAKKAEAEAYRSRYGLGDEEPPTADGLDELKAEYRIAQEAERTLRGEIATLESKANELGALKNELATLCVKLEELKRERALYDVAYKAIQKADATLKEIYLTPMQNSFVYFGKKLGVEWVDDVKLGDGLEVQFEALGRLRPDKHLSDGQRALSALCMRLALMENLHKGERPFCILDDPFVHLDEGHLAEVKKALKALSNDMQIIYFTCHSSRSM